MIGVSYIVLFFTPPPPLLKLTYSQYIKISKINLNLNK